MKSRDHERPTGILARMKERAENFIEPILNFWRHRFGGEVDEVLNHHVTDDPRAFLRADLAEVQQSMHAPDLVYLGCGEDLTVQNIFPNALHIDTKPMNAPFKRFEQGNVLALPLEKASQDLVVMRAMGYAAESDSRSASELARILRPNGKIVRDFPLPMRDVSRLDEALSQIHYLLIQENYGRNGLVLDRPLSSANVSFSHGHYNEAPVAAALASNRDAFYQILSTIPLERFTEAKESPFLSGRWAYHRALEFVLGISLRSPLETLRGQLTTLHSSLSPENMRKILSMVELLKRDYNTPD